MADTPDKTPEDVTTRRPHLLATKLRLPRPPPGFVAARGSLAYSTTGRRGS
jgi:hypothetical protein